MPNRTTLTTLAKSMHGTILLNRIQYLLNCEAKPNQTVCQYIAVGFQGANEKLREQDKKKPNDTGQPRRLSEEQIAFYTERGRNQPIGIIKGGKVKGARRLFDPEVIWELPDGGTGYVVYNRNDVDGRTTKGKSIGDKLGLDQIGTLETIERIMNIAREWNVLYPDRPLEIGDVSRPGGINTTEHQTHVGTEFDVRAQSKSKTIGGLTWKSSDYSYPLTKEFMLLVRRLYPTTTFHFNDTQILKDKDTRDFTTPAGGHDDHLHVMFR